ncbi:hypothetical protein ACIQU2_17430 [Pseudomonas sp. NPDC098740]|uniref:hypothetical protein n=1 Tax=Pseudomonas TaxID=286 RepID=UPI0024B3A56F|nr:hypothetical protein [Pseudomonas sp. PMCC200367]
MIWVKRFLMVVGFLACIASVLVVFRMDFSKDEPRVLSEYPNAKWRGKVLSADRAKAEQTRC